MITGQHGGFVHRIMPPVDWDCGPIPDKCYDQALSKRDIMALLLPVYLDPDRVKQLADSDDPMEETRAKIALEILAEIDAETIWVFNMTNTPLR